MNVHELRAQLVDLASKLYQLSDEARTRGHVAHPAVGTHDYWQGVAFGLQMGVSEVLTLIEQLSKSGMALSDE